MGHVRVDVRKITQGGKVTQGFGEGPTSQAEEKLEGISKGNIVWSMEFIPEREEEVTKEVL